jgi:hypothetical protein
LQIKKTLMGEDSFLWRLAMILYPAYEVVRAMYDGVIAQLAKTKGKVGSVVKLARGLPVDQLVHRFKAYVKREERRIRLIRRVMRKKNCAPDLETLTF